MSIALRRVGVGLTWFFCFGVALFSYRYLVGGVEATMDFVAYHAAIRPMAFYAHVGLAPVALALVPFQLWHGLRRTRPMIHRTLGRLYGIAILISGAGGLWLAINTHPDGDWDQAAYGGIELARALAVVSAGAVGALWLAPPVRRVMGWH